MAASVAWAADPARPNVVLIMADDLGYETIRANGGTSYQTPNLDALAAAGVRMEHCYAQPLCTPTRVQLMTGASNVRNYRNFGEMDPTLQTFGNLFQRAGYATCIAGKWQLGRESELPRKFGFDEYYLWQHLRRPPRYANPGLEINGIRRDYSDGQYGPDLINQFACDFIARHADRPFLLYYPMMLTHAPYQPTPDSDDWDPTARGERVHRDPKHFGDMVRYMDKLVGRIVEQLQRLDIADNTLLIFLGDNGTGRTIRSRLGDKVVQGGKGQTTTAGMHVPCIVRWPNVIREPRVLSELVDSTDFLPTICAAAGIQLPAEMPIDGHSFLGQLRGESSEPRQWIYSWYAPRGGPPQEFAFDKRYKLYRSGELFDLTTDRDEQRPLPQKQWSQDAKEAAANLQQALDRYTKARPDQLDS